jgi:hypothetical protein
MEPGIVGRGGLPLLLLRSSNRTRKSILMNLGKFQPCSSLVPRRVGTVLVFVAVMAIAIFCSFRPHEPSYQGKPLRAWLDEASKYGRNYEASEAADAVRNIGTNAIPDLVPC